MNIRRSGADLIEEQSLMEIDEGGVLMSQRLYERTLITNKSSLHGLFHIFLVQISEVLGDNIRVAFEKRFVPNFNYALDGAVVPLMDGAVIWEAPLFSYELKQQVSGDLSDQSLKDVKEFFLQAFYMRKNRKLWHCLTDMMDFHYFKCQDKDDFLDIQSYIYIHTDVTNLDSYKKHMLLLTKMFNNEIIT